VLIVPIEHHSTIHTLPDDVKVSIVAEIDQIKLALKKLYASQKAAFISFELARLSGKGGHAHVQVLPIPIRFQDVVEEAFRKEGGIEWEEEPQAALKEAEASKSSYFRVDLPDGRLMVHIIRGYFDMQLGRTVLTKLLGVPERSDWKICALSEDEDKRDADIFRKLYAPFDPSL